MQYLQKTASVSPDEAVAGIRSGERVFLHSAIATPQILSQALARRAGQIHDVEVVHIHTEGPDPFVVGDASESFRVNSLFTGSNLRKAVQQGIADYTPIFLSEVPLLFRRRILPLDTAILQVSPPDRNGYCSMGVSVDVALAASQCAPVLIAEINPNMPRTHGDSNIHISRFHKITEVDYPLPTLHIPEPDEREIRIGQYVSELVDNGATLQMGIGAIPNAALRAMLHHKELGIHTEMFSDGVLELVEKGVVTNQHKVKHRHYIVSGFLMGSQRLYDFVHDNPLVRMLDIAYVNDTAIIRKNPKVTAINSAIEVDITGQVCADSIGTNIYSGVGGQMDFIRGASLSEGGKPIIALPATTSKGESRIVTMLKPGAGVVTTRAHAHYIVTKYGISGLYGQTLRTRAKRLIHIAAPEHREALAKAAFDMWRLSI